MDHIQPFFQMKYICSGILYWPCTFDYTFQAFGGLLVAIVMKHCGNVEKGYATSVSLVLVAIYDKIYGEKQPPVSINCKFFVYIVPQ